MHNPTRPAADASRTVSAGHRTRSLAGLAAALIAIAATLTPSLAQADCQDDVTALQPQVDHAEPGRIKQLLSFDLKRAKQEMAEADEDECHAAIDHAQKLLRGEY